jgi:uncharacterized protein (TIGR02145 family)
MPMSSVRRKTSFWSQRGRPFVSRVQRKTRLIRLWSMSIALGLLSEGVATSPANLSAQESKVPAAPHSPVRMADGKQWTTQNLNLKSASSYCYEDAEANCLRYGRLYTWESARGACRSLGDGWRLPMEEDWRELAKHYGGVREDSKDSGKTAFLALLLNGNSGFNAVLGGGRDESGQYARLEAHGFYWTATENGPGAAWYYNFAKGSLSLNRQTGGEKPRAFSVRCVR